VSFAHLTLRTQEGGAPSPWALDQPGRILDIGCRLCGAIVRWDYFAAQDGETRLGKAIEVLRPPVPGWRNGRSFGSEMRGLRSGFAHRRAS
jgi:hypothetical protein